MMIVAGLIAAMLAPGIPEGPAPVARLSTADLQHHELLRLDRDFGKDHWEIALDGWTTPDTAIEEVRLWWVNTRKHDLRKPFSGYLERHVSFVVRHEAPDRVDASFAGDGKRFVFTVQAHPGEAPRIFTTVRTAAGQTIPRCRALHGRLIARRILGIPVGVARLMLTCMDEQGRRVRGVVTHRTAAATPAYRPR